MTEKEYRQLPAVSYSSLSKLANSPQAFKANLESEQEETPAMILGSVVDFLLTDPQRFRDEVYVMTASKPGVETMLKYCDTLAETGDSIQAYQASGYKISPQAVATKFDKEGRAYFDALLDAKGKTIIGAEDMFTANQIVETLKSNLFTKEYFLPSRDPNIELIFQHIAQWKVNYPPIDWKMVNPEQRMREMKVKSMIDVLHIDHEKELITPIDLKTGAEGFYKSYWRWKRYLQAAMYTDAITYEQEDHSIHWKDSRIDRYLVAPLKFIYADTKLISPPMIYTSTSADIQVGRAGLNYLVPVAGLAKAFDDKEIMQIDSIGFGPSEIKKTKGYIQLIAELDWHKRNEQWDYTPEDFNNEGERQIDAFSIKL